MTDFRRGSFYREQIEKNSSDSFWFCLIFCVSMAVRAVASCTSFAQIYPDEIYQTVEMAHKLAFGKAITYWEFRVGARSWFLPGILAGVYKILDFFGVIMIPLSQTSPPGVGSALRRASLFKTSFDAEADSIFSP